MNVPLDPSNHQANGQNRTFLSGDSMMQEIAARKANRGLTITQIAVEMETTEDDVRQLLQQRQNGATV